MLLGANDVGRLFAFPYPRVASYFHSSTFIDEYLGPTSMVSSISAQFMTAKPSNDTVIEKLRHGLAEFELVSTPVPSISISSHRPHKTPTNFLTYSSHLFFAIIGGGVSPAMKKIECYSVQRITGDGRCMFRALVKGMAFNKGVSLNSREERDNADELRTAVKEVICDDEKEHRQYEEALIAITVDEPLKRYCQRVGQSNFWGGESELLVLSKLCHQPIIVYIPEHEHTKGSRGSGFIPIAEYGAEFGKKSWKGKPRKPVRLLYSGKNHYDLLV